MAVTAIDHVLLAMPPGGEARGIAFYCGLLGFTELPKPDPLAGRGGVWMKAGSAVLHLGSEEGFTAPRRAHPAFLVDDLDAHIATLRANDVELQFDVPLPGYKRIHARDPFGNRIELMEVVAPALRSQQASC
jgi:catechol 2,3-dioxygenase-like lactoylglutathione lyase family enzyme